MAQSGNAMGGWSSKHHSANGTVYTPNTPVGSGNTGYRNTGYRNTGYRNTGDGNATDYCSGFFCIEPQTVRCFDTDTGLTREEFISRYPCYYDLCFDLGSDKEISFTKYAHLPGITPEKLKTLHEKHKAGRARPEEQE